MTDTATKSASAYRLSPSSPLGGFRHEIGGTTLEEVTGLALVSIATPMGGEDALNAVVKSAYGGSLPAPGNSVLNEENSVRLLGLQRDQVFALFPHEGDYALRKIADALGEAGYYTDQSDGWAMIRLSGPLALAALERICPLDLDSRSFPEGAVARTAMEHVNTVILREGTECFLLMAARSYAESLHHAVEVSVRNVA